VEDDIVEALYVSSIKDQPVILVRGDPESPMHPGVYWFQGETRSRALMVGVRLKDAKLTVWWPNQDVPVTNLKGVWRGPIPPSSALGSRSHSSAEMKYTPSPHAPPCALIHTPPRMSLPARPHAYHASDLPSLPCALPPHRLACMPPLVIVPGVLLNAARS
jgi:hypothetical protein